MAEGFTKLAAEARTFAGSQSEDTTFQITPAVGDIVGVICEATVASLGLSSSGATWSKIDDDEVGNGGDKFGVWRCTGAGSLDNLTITSTGDNMLGYAAIAIQPTNLTYVGIANTSGVIDTADSAGSLTVAMNSGASSRNLAIGCCSANLDFNTDSGWTEIDNDTRAADFGIAAQYVLGDDAEWVCDPTGAASALDIAALVLEFASLETGKLVNGGLVNHGLVNGGLVHRAWSKVNGIWQRPTRLLVPVGIQLAGAK